MSLGTTNLTGDGADPLARVIVSPSLGRFTAHDGAIGAPVSAGDVVGTVTGPAGVVPVTSPFGGVLGGMLALDGELLRDAQPVAWLHDERALAVNGVTL